MSNVPEFHFDFKAVQGKPFEDAAEALFRQLEAHYNEHIRPAPIIFGGSKVAAPVVGYDPASPNGDKEITTVMQDNKVTHQFEGKLIRVEPDYEIKEGSELGLKDGKVLVGVRSDTKAEIFDFLKDYDPQDQIVTGESGKYDLGRKDD